MNLGPIHDLPGALGMGANQQSAGDDDELKQAQQAKLTDARLMFCSAAAVGPVSRLKALEMQRYYKILAGKIHIDRWEELLPTMDAIQRAGPDYQRGIVVLGGWFHEGAADKVEAPPQDLLTLFRQYRRYYSIEKNCRAVLNASPESKVKAEDELIKVLAAFCLPKDISQWRNPRALMRRISEEKPGLEAEIEAGFLFLKRRIFLFSPTAKSPTAGWDDFFRFVFSYRLLVDRFSTKFDQYFWGVYPPSGVNIKPEKFK